MVKLMAPLPYITSSGNIEKALNGIKSAQVPERVSQDFVKTILKVPGGSGDQMTTFLKKLNFAQTDGTPTELYTKFRNPTTSGESLAKAIKHAYAPLYVRNEFMHTLDDNELMGLIVEETGLAHDSSPAKYALACIKALKKNADFETTPDENDPFSEDANFQGLTQMQEPRKEHHASSQPNNIGLNLGYTINLNLPATSDQSVFNAIFKSLKEHLLSDDDA